MSRYRSNEVLVPRPAGIFQHLANVFLGPFLQIGDLRVDDPIWQLAHVPLQFPIHCLQAAEKEFCVIIRGIDPEPWVGVSGWIDDEVWEGLVEWSNRLIDVVLENEEGVN